MKTQNKTKYKNKIIYNFARTPINEFVLSQTDYVKGMERQMIYDYYNL